MHQIKLREIFLKEVSNITKGYDNIAIALSSGKDSNSILFALLELKKKVRAYNFHVEGIESQDYINAKRNCDIFKIEFIECIIPKIVDINIVRSFIKEFKTWRKTRVECFYPYYFLYPKVKENLLLIGLASDDHFCLTKHGLIHHAKNLKDLQEYRKEETILSYDSLRIHNGIFKKLSNNSDNKTYDPFVGKEVIKWFFNKTWEEINKPIQKQALLDMFPEYFSKINLFKRMNLQGGDSGIREIFEPLLKNPEINKKGRQRVIDLYRDIYWKVNKPVQLLIGGGEEPNE